MTDNAGTRAPGSIDLRRAAPADAARPAVESGATRRAAGWLDRTCRRLVLRQLERLADGQLAVVEQTGGELVRFGSAEPGEKGELAATVTVHRPDFWRRVAVGGSVGAGEAYMDGCWTADDLTRVVRLLVRNREALEGMETGLGWLARLPAAARRLLHLRRANTLSGSRRNIEAHYDLSNEFFELFLDPTMMYSCALFDPPGIDLEAASVAKLDRICRKLELSPDDHVLEIGTGWGGFAEHAAGRYGCRVTTTTISPAQREVALRRIAAAGLADRVTILDRDYRRLEGRFDKLVSIEMIEAVGARYLDDFFAQCSRLLAPHGVMLLQAITIADRFYRQALSQVDFIQRFIFPGAFLPSVSALTDSLARVTDLRAIHLEDIGPHYAETLAAWRRRFTANLDRVRHLGFSERFIRMWEFYFCYCEGGFLERSIGDIQLLLEKPRAAHRPLLGSLS